MNPLLLCEVSCVGCLSTADMLKDYGSLFGSMLGVLGAFTTAVVMFKMQSRRDRTKEHKVLSEKRNFIIQQCNALIVNSQKQIDSIDLLIKRLQETGIHESLYGKTLSYSINLENIFSIERFELYKLFVEDLEIDNKIYYYTNLIKTVSFLKASFEESEKNHMDIINQYLVLHNGWVDKYKIFENAVRELGKEADKNKQPTPNFNTDIVETFS